MLLEKFGVYDIKKGIERVIKSMIISASASAAKLIAQALKPRKQTTVNFLLAQLKHPFHGIYNCKVMISRTAAMIRRDNG